MGKMDSCIEITRLKPLTVLCPIGELLTSGLQCIEMNLIFASSRFILLNKVTVANVKGSFSCFL